MTALPSASLLNTLVGVIATSTSRFAVWKTSSNELLIVSVSM